MGSDLIERLRAQGERASEISRQMAEDKSLRQEGNHDRRTDLYMFVKPEQTLESKAADEITALRATIATLEAGIKRFIADFEGDFTIEGVIVDAPDPMLKAHYLLLRALLANRGAASGDGK